MSELRDESGRGGWASAWPDGLAFVAGLAMAWFNSWQTKDLVWSLWLSSLVVGYAMIVWNIFGPTRSVLTQVSSTGGTPTASIPINAAKIVGGLFVLAFFTVHFGGFHFVHSVFLSAFFPVVEGERGMPGAAIYWQVFRDYWLFVLVAAVAERQAFQWPKATDPNDDNSVTRAAISARQARQKNGDSLMGPYKNVIRLHLLIFFFAFASFAKLDNFLIYAVVYAVYFFPWRLLKRAKAA